MHIMQPSFVGPFDVVGPRHLPTMPMLFGYVFDQYLAPSRVVNGATVRCCKKSPAGPWQVGDTHHW